MKVKPKSKMATITDEVAQLHPLLKLLLPKLLLVDDVEYTHGVSEFGADFVLRKHDATFGIPAYVGVIAKVGRIVQDFTEVERQIDECGIPRTFFGGKEKVRIDEVWVLSTDTISKNAQEKMIGSD